MKPEEVGKKSQCYYFRDGDGLHAIHFHSPESNFTYSLVPTRDWPTISISGIKMHEASPRSATNARMRLLKPGRGNALDVCTGLGYTAMALAGKGAKVTTLEADENVLEIARYNPRSEGLFSNPSISLVVGDAFEKIRGLPSGGYKWVCHDPPRYPRGASLYSLDFYKELSRVMARGALLFHYTGKPYSKYRKRAFVKGVGERLREAGFERVKWREEAKGFTAVKA